MGFRGALPGLAALLLMAAQALAADEFLSLPHGGLTRFAWVTDGRADRSKPAPLILALHGFQPPELAERRRAQPEDLAWPALTEEARRRGVIAVFPAAHRGQWALFPGLPNTLGPGGEPIDDEAFILALVDRLVAQGRADPSRLFLTGISDGAIMAYRLACRAHTPFAAVAPLIGTPQEETLAECTPDPPPALLHLHGTEDRVLPYEGWLFPGGRSVSVPETMEHWRRLHGCTGQQRMALEDLDPEDGSTVELMVWTGCQSTEPVIRYKVIGGGHDIPATDAPQPAPSARHINRDIDTMTLIAEFFTATRPRPLP
ncbi:MAG: PHB depolymerase family esterase [Roseovarius sp.]